MYTNKFFILVSNSKSRKLILRNAGLNFKTNKNTLNEDILKKKLLKQKKKPKTISLELAKNKAKKTEAKNKIIIGSDTVIELNGKIVEKAKNTKEAKAKIKKMSGKKHFIFSSAVAYYNKKIIWKNTSKTTVYIRKLNSKEIDKYLRESGKSILESVGCYQIEKKGPTIIKKINGDFFNVMGFPLFPFLNFLKKFKIEKWTKKEHV